MLSARCLLPHVNSVGHSDQERASTIFILIIVRFLNIHSYLSSGEVHQTKDSTDLRTGVP